MLSDLLERVYGTVYYHVRGRAPFANAALAGRNFTVSKGAIRDAPDYDDAWLLALALDSERMLDVGANVGQAALICLLSPKMRDIVLVDPNSEALAVAADNLIRNGLGTRARFVQTFASSQDGADVVFWTIGTGAAGSVYAEHSTTARAKGSHTIAKTRSMDSLCSELGFAPDLVKVDVEGAESEVLDGCEALASEKRARFLVEMHSNPSLAMKDNTLRVLAWCLKNHHRAWYLRDGVELLSADQICGRGRCHLLLAPAAWPYPEYLKGVSQSDSLDTVLKRQ